MDSNRPTSYARRLAAAAASLLVLALVTACGDDSEAQEPPQLVGVQLHPLWTGASPRQNVRELDIAKRAGAQVVRIDMGWATLEHDGKGRFSRAYGRRVD